MNTYNKNIIHYIKTAAGHLGLVCLLSPGLAIAAPSGGITTHGAATITTNGGITTVDQSSARAVVTWDSFNLNASEGVLFEMGTSNAILNIINDSNESVIAGAIRANGQVFMVNNKGIVFTQSSNISVGSFVATSLNIDSDDFINADSMSGNFGLLADETVKGTIINYGLIKAATGGNVALLGNSIINTGQIHAVGGRATLAAGEAMTVAFDSSGLMQFEVTKEVSQNIDGLDSAIVNDSGGLIRAQEVVMQAHVAADIFTNAINHKGTTKLIVGSDGAGQISLIAQGGAIIQGESSIIDAPTPEQIVIEENLLDEAGIAEQNETVDTDGDGVGDNTDAFPNDASETTDTDGDGVGDNADAFPNDASETTDTDGDGVGDNEAAAQAAAEAEAAAQAAAEAEAAAQIASNTNAASPTTTSVAGSSNSNLGLLSTEGSTAIQLPDDQNEEEL